MHLSGIKATNIDLTDAIKVHVEKQIVSFEKLTKGLEPAAILNVEVGKTTQHHSKGPYFFAEINLSVPGTLLRSREEKENLYDAIDSAKNQLRRQLKDYKNKLIDRSQRGSRPGKE